MFSGLLQDWTTIDGAGTAPSVQTRTDWLDLALFADVVLWLEVRSVTKPGAGDVVLTYETSPCTDDSIFQPLGTVTLAASSTPVITQVKLSANPLIPLGRYVRWKLAGTATGNWSGTFRVFAMANRGSSGATFTPATLAGLVGWYDSETNESPGTNNGAVDSLGDQSAAGNNIAGTSPNRPVWRSGQFAAGTKHSIDTTGGTPDFLAATSVVVCANGYSAFATFKTTTVRTTATQPNIDPPMTILGNSAASAWNNFGLNGQNVSYCYFSPTNYGGWHEYVSSGLTLADGNRHTIAVTHDKVTGVIRLYADGVLVYTETIAAADYSAANTGFKAMGVGYLVNDPFLGQFAEAIVCNSALTSVDIANLHARAASLW